jgi:low affinity Fe/Cu permease
MIKTIMLYVFWVGGIIWGYCTPKTGFSWASWQLLSLQVLIGATDTRKAKSRIS